MRLDLTFHVFNCTGSLDFGEFGAHGSVGDLVWNKRQNHAARR